MKKHFIISDFFLNKFQNSIIFFKNITYKKNIERLYKKL